MGFSLQMDGSQKGRLIAGQPGEPLKSFIDVIRLALSQRVTSFQVDLSAEPDCLSKILEPLKKLQQLVGSRGQTVSILGSGLLSQSPLYIELKKTGMTFPDVTEEDLVFTTSEGSGVIDADVISEELKILFKELDTDFEGKLVMPPPERVSPYMLAVKGRLTGLLKIEENLKAEEETLLRRLTLLKKLEPESIKNGDRNMDEFNRLLDEEKQIDLLRESIGKLKKELVVAKESATNQEKVYKEYVARVDSEGRKKQELLNKELGQLQENLIKATAELEKKKAKGNPQ
jgi:hypothetical protein